jgi:CheY-like chemotaxis protein
LFHAHLLTLQSTNAIKFTKGQPTRKITVEFGGSWDRPPRVWKDVTFTTDGKLQTDTQNEPEWGSGTKAYLWIKVKDSGCGMTEPEQKNLFARFTQASPKTHITYGGSGLGLFICKTLVTMHGGAIGVFSEKNAGSTFAFFVGTRVCEAPTDQTSHNSPELRPEPGERTMSFEDAMKAIKLRVLVVEDNLVNQRVLKKQLQKLGWTVHVAGDGQEALDWLCGSTYWREKVDVDVSNKVGGGSDHDSPGQHGHELDLILLDIEMPVLDGLACARQIRDWENRGFLAHSPTLSRSPSSPPGPVSSNTSRRGSGGIVNFRLPILAVTANARIEQIQEALRAGMDDAITKPFRLSDLWPKIQRLLPGLTDEHGSAS